jgi:hypothetical protein
MPRTNSMRITAVATLLLAASTLMSAHHASGRPRRLTLGAHCFPDVRLITQEVLHRPARGQGRGDQARLYQL